MRHLLLALTVAANTAVACPDPKPYLGKGFELSFQGQSVYQGQELKIFAHADGRWVAVYSSKVKQCLVAIGLQHRFTKVGEKKV